MNTLTQNILLSLVGILLVGISLFGFTKTTEAGCTWYCSGGYQSFSCVTDSIYWPGGYYGGGWCGYGAGYYGAGTYYCYGTCQTWNSCASMYQVCVPDCTTAYGSTSCNQNLTQYGVPSSYTVGTAYYSYNTCDSSNVTYLGYSCSAPPLPTPSLSQSVSSTVSGTPYTISWGSTNATSCVVNYTGPDGGGTISSGPTSGGPLTLVSTIVGTYTAQNLCSGAGGTNYATVTHVVTAPIPVPTTPTVFITPNPVGLNQVISVSWPTSGATSYNYKVDGITVTTISPTATSVSGTPLYFGFTTSGSHKVEVQACNVTGCSSYGTGSFDLITAPTISTFTTTNGILSLSVGGGPVTLTWSSINTTSCTASNGWSGTKPTSGSETISVSSTATYDLTCQ